jgi:hypothetical protein
MRKPQGSRSLRPSLQPLWVAPTFDVLNLLVHRRFEQQRFNPLYCLLLHVRQNMAVGVEREHNCRVAESFTCNLRILTVRK